MGTNVYAFKKRPDTSLFDKYKETGIKKFLYQFLDYYNKHTEENKVHLGKRSGGWKFVFNHNNWKYYDYTEESIKEFLKSCDRIFDEYDNDYTVEEFWKKFIDSGKDGFDGQDYYKYELERAGSNELGALDSRTAHELYNQAVMHNWYEEEYYNNKVIPYDKLNYRFSNSTDFS